MATPSRSEADKMRDDKMEAAESAEATPGKPPELSSQKPKSTPTSEFWLVAKIEDCKVVTAQETASAKCFLKFHWQDAVFLDKIRDEKLARLGGEGFAEIESNLKLERLAVDLAKGEMVYGMVDATADHFPINIDAIFANQISAERLSSLGWTKYDKEKGVVSVQIVSHVTVHVPMRLERYPYDRHVVPFCLGTRATNEAGGVVRKWKLSKEWPDWAPSQYPEDKFLLLASQTTPDLEYDHKQCFVYREGKKPILCVLIERAPKNVLKRIALPVFIVVNIALAVSGVEEGDFNDEFEVALTSLLTLTAFSYSVQSSLPKLPYLTLADCYFLLGFSIHLLIVLKVIIASQECIDTSDHLNRTYLGGTVCQERNHGMTIFLAACWLLLHAALFLDILFPIFTNCVRVSYKKLIEEYAEKFFSDTVTCKMGEDIHDLESRDKRETKGDIYKARRIEKKLAAEKKAGKAEKKKAGQAESSA
eukprot:CAMPEP_0118830536 /NCGR_PEP_ID=MMETSP1162-20130426/27731_1 /TAXON_ID=33656 /ORGANISM="Phaeocystis Sp, Strain CCMP2710" /LENGTH=476 /DNA_ID=CAMNT_0006761877 /DNA_START=20 /DNA_END=1450 /DNA_ORIENTATION=+